MEFAYKKVSIMSPFPTTQYGHMTQTYDVFNYKDALYARISCFRDDKLWIVHISADVLSIDKKYRNRIEKVVREYYDKDEIVVITSATHTHYANSSKNERYMEFFCNTVISNIFACEYQKINEPESSFAVRYTISAGKSRITGFESGKEYLWELTVCDGNKPIWCLLIHNAHPTTLRASVDYFSAEYPGYVLRKMEESYPNVAFSWCTGAAGDISSRFVRKGQEYEDMEEIGEALFADAKGLFAEEKNLAGFTLKYNETIVAYEHDYSEIDLSKIRGNLSERELQTIEYGKIMRKNLDNSITPPTKEALVCSLDFGSGKVIFYPNEIFSDYLDCVDVGKCTIASYSNGYGPYILPVGFGYVTYEMFLDTLTVETKERIKKTLNEI